MPERRSGRGSETTRLTAAPATRHDPDAYTLMLRWELASFQVRYIATIDNDRLEEWPGLFTEDCMYQIISKENVDFDLPAPVMHGENAAMPRDRVLSLRHANIYAQPAYRHFISGLEIAETDGGYTMRSSYLVINTSLDGESTVYQAGRCDDLVVRTADGLRFKRKRCIYDTLRVQTLLAYPI